MVDGMLVGRFLGEALQWPHYADAYIRVDVSGTVSLSFHRFSYVREVCKHERESMAIFQGWQSFG